MTAAIELRDVCVRRGGRRVLDGLSLRVEHGERVAILGANGVGKSTLLDVILGITSPDAGSRTLSGPGTRSLRVGLVSQDPDASLLPWLSAGANVELPLRLAGLATSARRAALEDVRARFDPLGVLALDRSPAALSGGERQLVAVMRAFVGAPTLVVGDEPLSAIDVVARVRLRDAMLSSCRELGTTLVVVSHDLADVAAVAARAVVLDGRPGTVRADLRISDGDVSAIETALRGVSSYPHPPRPGPSVVADPEEVLA